MSNRWDVNISGPLDNITSQQLLASHALPGALRASKGNPSFAQHLNPLNEPYQVSKLFTKVDVYVS
jgi:hypothetical protein